MSAVRVGPLDGSCRKTSSNTVDTQLILLSMIEVIIGYKLQYATSFGVVRIAMKSKTNEYLCKLLRH